VTKIDPSEAGFERILVPLDVSCEARPALELAASIAAALQSRLEGLFIEDHDVLAAVDLPFTRAVPMTGGGPQDIDRERLERVFRQKAAASEQLLAGIARTRRIDWAFRVTRGHAETAIRSATRQRDLVAMIRGSGTTVRHGEVGGAVRAAVRQNIRSILITGRDTAVPAAGVTAVYGESASSGAALRLAERIARNTHARLTVLVSAKNELDLRRLKSQAETALTADGETRFELLVDKPLGTLSERLRRLRSGLIVASADAVGDGTDLLERLAAQIHSPLLLLGPAEPQPSR